MKEISMAELWTAIDEYVDAKIALRTLHMRPNLNQEEVEERCSEKSTKLMEVIRELKR